jgi:hypothetical protein
MFAVMRDAMKKWQRGRVALGVNSRLVTALLSTKTRLR